MTRQLCLTKFSSLSIDDPFFDTLKAGYSPFPKWFASKANEDVYVVYNGSILEGMIYLKTEVGTVKDVTPPLPNRRWLKVGTLKVVPKGTKLGERIIKKIFDTALATGSDGIYVTVFAVHKSLITLFKRYGFLEYAIKKTVDGTELVLARQFDVLQGDIIKDYPLIHRKSRSAWLIGIYPEYHTKLLPDSILKGEPQEIVQDVSHTNTIHKMYIGRTALSRMARGDAVIVYRTTDKPGHAKFRSVTTSVCVVEEVRKRSDFKNADAFVAYTKPHSVFTEKELRAQYAGSSRVCVVKMTYNAAFKKRTIRKVLIEKGLLAQNARCDLLRLTDKQFDSIIKLGGVDARLIVD